MACPASRPGLFVDTVKWLGVCCRVTLMREAGRLAPFLAGFAIVGCLILKVTSTITEDDIRKSRMTNSHAGEKH